MKDKQILVVDDEPKMRRVLEIMLQKLGHRVLSAGNGREALAVFQANTIDLVITDLRMPEMDGIELAQHAAQIAPDMRVMFITGFAAVTLKAGKTMPQAKVLSKPFHLRDLVLEVERVFQTDASASGL